MLDNQMKDKYLKYKLKYNQLKQQLEQQSGGAYRCSKCYITFTSFNELRIHKRNVHNQPGSQVSTHRLEQNRLASKRKRDSIKESGVGGHKCNHCDMIFYDKRYLVSHLLRFHEDLINREEFDFILAHSRNLPFHKIRIDNIARRFRGNEEPLQRPIALQRPIELLPLERQTLDLPDEAEPPITLPDELMQPNDNPLPDEQPNPNEYEEINININDIPQSVNMIQMLQPDYNEEVDADAARLINEVQSKDNNLLNRELQEELLWLSESDMGESDDFLTCNNN